MYGQLVVGATLDTRKIEQGAEFIDTMMRGLARANWVIPVRIDTKSLGTQIGGVTKALSKPITVQVKLTAIPTGLDRIATQSKAAADAVKKTEADIKKLEASLKQTGSTAATTGGSLSSMGRNLSVISTIGSGVSRMFVGLTRSLYSFLQGRLLMPLLYRGFSELKEATLGYSITLERAKTSLTSMLGGSEKAAGAFLDKLESFAIRTQFNFDDLAALAPQLRVAKIATEDLIPTFTALGDAVTASAKGREGLKNLVGDLQSMSARGKVTGQDIRNFGNNGVNIVTYLAQAYSSILPKGTKNAEMAMRSMITKGLIPSEQGIKAIVEGIGNDPLKSGQMAKQAKTFEGAMSNIGDAIKRVFGKEAFGQTFQWLTERVNQFLNVVSSPAMLQWGKDMGPKVLAAAKAIADFAAGAVRFGVDVYNVGVDVAGAFTHVAQSIVFAVSVGKKLLPVLEAAAVGVALSFARVGAIATWAFVQTIPASIATGVASLRQFVVLARTAQVAWAYVPAVILAGVVAVTEGFAWLVDKTYDLLEKVPGISQEWLKKDRQGWEDYKKQYSDGFDVLKDIAQDKMAKIANFFLPDMSKYKIDLSGVEKMFKDAQMQSVFGDAVGKVFAPFGKDDLNTNSASAAAKAAARAKKLETDRLSDAAAS
ncbi:hypothetical protein IAD21_03721 [Abditibacteriota bacterium]|nr:hypothetical protein IAD21_03721 [Abditibacteriota bacterium]